MAVYQQGTGTYTSWPYATIISKAVKTPSVMTADDLEDWLLDVGSRHDDDWETGGAHHVSRQADNWVLVTIDLNQSVHGWAQGVVDSGKTYGFAPIVAFCSGEGWEIIDGRHRASTAAGKGVSHVPAYVPTADAGHALGVTKQTAKRLGIKAAQVQAMSAEEMRRLPLDRLRNAVKWWRSLLSAPNAPEYVKENVELAETVLKEQGVAASRWRRQPPLRLRYDRARFDADTKEFQRLLRMGSASYTPADLDSLWELVDFYWRSSKHGGHPNPKTFWEKDNEGKQNMLRTGVEYYELGLRQQEDRQQAESKPAEESDIGVDGLLKSWRRQQVAKQALREGAKQVGNVPNDLLAEIENELSVSGGYDSDDPEDRKRIAEDIEQYYREFAGRDVEGWRGLRVDDIPAFLETLKDAETYVGQHWAIDPIGATTEYSASGRMNVVLHAIVPKASVSLASTIVRNVLAPDEMEVYVKESAPIKLVDISYDPSGKGIRDRLDPKAKTKGWQTIALGTTVKAGKFGQQIKAYIAWGTTAWITPDGQEFNAEGDHIDWIVNHPNDWRAYDKEKTIAEGIERLKRAETEREISVAHGDIMRGIISQGWVRVTSEGFSGLPQTLPLMQQYLRDTLPEDKGNYDIFVDFEFNQGRFEGDVDKFLRLTTPS